MRSDRKSLRLRLCRETVRPLDDGALDPAQGGATVVSGCLTLCSCLIQCTGNTRCCP